MRIVAFDVMGNDHGTQPAIDAAYRFIKSHAEYQIILVGDESQIGASLAGRTHARLLIHDVKAVVKGELGARAARDGDNSMAVAITMVRDGKAHAVLSAGNSAAYITLATLILRRLVGIKRPAFMPLFPTIVAGRQFVLLDAGANIEVTAEMLIQWARVGSIFARETMALTQPRVGLINIGTEDEKGLATTREAHTTLRSAHDLNYVGFVEPRDLLNAVVDVAVVDGYGGNLILKTMEGTALALMRSLKTSLMRGVLRRMGALLSRGAFRELRARLDYRNIGAAWIIGVDGLAIKSHGASDAQAFAGAFRQIELAFEHDALAKVATALALGGTKDENA